MSGVRCWSSSSTGGLAGIWRQWWTMYQQLQWRSRVISRSTCCAKNEPAPRNVHLGGQLGFFASGGLAAVGSLTVVYPLDYARTRLASDVGSGKKTLDGLFDCLKKVASKGFFSFHAGFGVSLGGIIPYRGFQLGVFDTIVGLNPWKNDTGMMGYFSTFAAAQTAIIAGAGISSPFDSVRRRLQMQAEKPVEQHIYKGTVDRLKKIAAEEGIAAGVYKGFVANALRSVGGARRWCFTTEPSTIWAWAARAVASGVSRPTVLLVSFSSTHLRLQIPIPSFQCVS